MMGSGTNADLYVDENKNHANNTVRYSTVQYSTVQYNTVQYSTIQFSSVQFSPVYPAPLVEYDESPCIQIHHNETLGFMRVQFFISTLIEGITIYLVHMLECM